MAKREPDFKRSAPAVPPPPVGLVLGFLLGAGAGTATLGLELAVLGWMGVGVPDPEGLAMAGATYAVLGGLLGGVPGATGVWGGGWALAWGAGAAALALGARAGAAALAVGLPGAVGVLAIGLGALAFGQVAGRVGRMGPVQMGLGTALVVFCAAAGSLHLHLLSSASTPLALVVTGAAAVVAALAGVVVGVVSSGERAPLPQLVLANAAMIFALWPLLGGLRATAPGTTVGGRPVVWITIEGLRHDATSRGPDASTPEISRFLSGALHYRHAHATAPWSVPSLASLHTGRLPHKHGAAMNDGRGNVHGPLGANVPTAAQIFAADGYLTAAVSGDAWLDAYGLHAGYQWFADTPPQGPLPLWIDSLALFLGFPPWPVRQDAAAVTDQALEVVRAQSGGRWFLWVHYVDAGGPFLAPEHDRTAIGKTVRPWPVDAWEASLLSVDREVGRLLEGLPDDAVVVLAGTHGVVLEEERSRGKGVPRTAVDGFGLYQELIRVPLGVRAEGLAARAVDRPVSLIDVLPSLLERQQVESVPRIDGRVLREFGGDPPEEPVPILAMSLRWGPEQGAVRIGQDKIIVRPDGTGPLFDLAGDDREILARPADARNEQLERRLRSELPPMGRGPELFEAAPLSESLGRWLQASWRRRAGN